MRMESEELGQGFIRIRLNGRLNMQGTQAVETQFAALTSGEKVFAAVDMSQVSFLASIGMRMLLSGARAANGGGGAVALYGVQAMVMQVLQTSGVASLIPVESDFDAASAVLVRASK